MTTKEAIEHLQDQLKNDPDYRFGWQSNIAMAFVDEYRANAGPPISGHLLKEIANKAADRFLKNMCAPTE